MDRNITIYEQNDIEIKLYKKLDFINLVKFVWLKKVYFEHTTGSPRKHETLEQNASVSLKHHILLNYILCFLNMQNNYSGWSTLAQLVASGAKLAKKHSLTILTLFLK